tara:strand:+ start:1410 stop:1613 length:204 start_codon:yes stop_codon:yes gene_type:complete
LAKIDKSQYTKAQWNIVRAARRKEKDERRAEKARSKNPSVEAVIPPQEPTVALPSKYIIKIKILKIM